MRREWSGWIKNRQWEEFEREARTNPSQMLANTASELLRGFPDKGDKRALKRILYYLSQAGYEPDDIEEGGLEPLSEKTPFERAYFTSADSGGDSDVIYAKETGAKVRWLFARINETEGVVGAKEEESLPEENEARIDRILKDDVFPMITVEADPAFLLWRIKRALTKNRRGIPPTIAYWRSVLEKAEEVKHPALELPRQTATDEEMRKVAFEVTPALLWRLELGAAAPLLRKLQEAPHNHEPLSDAERRERTNAIIDETRREVFTQEIVEDHAMRLLDLTFILDLAGRAGTGLIMATYDDLLLRGADSQYAKGVMDKTVMTYVETMRSSEQPKMSRAS